MPQLLLHLFRKYSHIRLLGHLRSSYLSQVLLVYHLYSMLNIPFWKIFCCKLKLIRVKTIIVQHHSECCDFTTCWKFRKLTDNFKILYSISNWNWIFVIFWCFSSGLRLALQRFISDSLFSFSDEVVCWFEVLFAEQPERRTVANKIKIINFFIFIPCFNKILIKLYSYFLYQS